MFLARRVPPRIDESLAGYLMRVAEANYLRSRESVLQSFLGKASRLPRVDEIEHLARFTRCSVSEVSQLFGFERRLEDRSACWKIGEEWVTKRNFVSSRTLACCPSCLAEDPYLPGVWELSFYRTCAVHRTNLIYQCPECRKNLRWTRAGVCTCNCGFDLRKARAMTGSQASWVLAQLIEHRLYSDFKLVVPTSLPIHMVERLANLTLDGLFKTIWFLGHCIADFGSCGSGHGRVQPRGDQVDRIIEEAFAMLADWPQSLANKVNEFANRGSGSKKNSFYRNALGPIASYMAEDIQDEELAFLRSTYEAHIRLRWRQLGRKSDLGADGRQLEFEWAKEPAGGELVA